MSQSLNQTEEAKQLLGTAKTMIEALQQTIDLMKDTQLSESEISPSHSVEATPPPLDMQESGSSPLDTVSWVHVVFIMSELLARRRENATWIARG